MGLLMNFIRNGYLLGILLLLILVEKPCLSGANSVAIAAAGNSHALEQLQVQLDDMVAASASGNVHQLAACRINSKELLATAESTARGVLQGVCNPRQIEDRLHNLETQMADQFNVIKTMLLNIEDKMTQQGNQYRRANRKLHGAVVELTESVQGCTTSNPNFSVDTDGLDDVNTPNDAKPASEIPAIYKPAKSLSGVKSTGADPDDYDESSSNYRQEEIDRFNSTIYVENGKRVFSYYWQVYDVEYKVSSWGPRRSLRSPSFYIFTYGYMMYLRIYPRQNGRNVYIHVGLTKGEYDESLEWPFTLRHRITVLDQSPVSQDIVSRIWDPKVLCSAWNWRRPGSGDNYECVGLGFPHEDLHGQSFIRDDHMIIKLTVYLD